MKSLYRSILDTDQEVEETFDKNYTPVKMLQILRSVFGKLTRDEKIAKSITSHLGEADVKKLGLTYMDQANKKVKELINQLDKIMSKNKGTFKYFQSGYDHRTYFGIDEFHYEFVCSLPRENRKFWEDQYIPYVFNVVLIGEEGGKADELRIAAAEFSDEQYEELIRVAKEIDILYR